MTKFIPLTNVNLSEYGNSYLITGFQGFGLVGYLSTRHLVRELKLVKIGFIKTRYMPEVTVYTRDLGLLYPFEVYAGRVDSKKIIVILHNGTPVEKERVDYSEYLALFARQLEVKEVLLIGGLSIDLKEEEHEQYRWIPLSNTSIVLGDAKILEERQVVGPLALTMMFMQAYGLPGVVILPFTEPFRPNPKAGAVAVNVISRIIGVDISIQRLIEEEALIEAFEEERAKVERAIEEAEKRSRLTYIS